MIICQRCKVNPATVHMTTNHHGQQEELDLCKHCAAQLEDNHFSQDPFDTLFKGLLEYNNKKTAKVCPTCKTTYQEYKKIGKVGCADCYEVFGEEINYILKRIQGNNQHTGKFPCRGGAGIRLRHRLEQLRVALKESIQQEAFEEAARLRDEIRFLEKEAKDYE